VFSKPRILTDENRAPNNVRYAAQLVVFGFVGFFSGWWFGDQPLWRFGLCMVALMVGGLVVVLWALDLLYGRDGESARD